MQRPLVFLVLALMIGVIGATVSGIDVAAAMMAAVFALTMAGIGILRAWRVNAWVLFCVCVALGMVLTSMKLAAVESPMLAFKGKSVRLVGTVIDRPDVRPEVVFYKLELRTIAHNHEMKPTNGVLRVKIKGQGRVYHYGDLLEMTGLLGVPDPPGNPGAFDYRAWLNRQGIAATLTVQDAREVRYLNGGGNPVLRTAYGLRSALERIFDQTMTKTNAAVVKGILFGTRGEIPQEVQLAFNETGLVHILSVSGYHVGLVTVILLALLRFMRIPTRFTAWVAIPALIFYAIMTGLGPAVFRSTIMAVLLLLAHHLGRQQDWPTTLAAAAGMILVVNPLHLYDIGFQLSFAATWGLLYLTPVMTQLFPRLPRTFSLLIAVPLAAQLATLPLVVLYFNLVSLVSVLANLLTAYLVALIMLFSGISLPVGVIFLPLAGFINASTGLLTDLFLWLVQFCSALPGAARYIPAPPLWLVFLYYLLLVGVFELLRRPRWQDKLKHILGDAVVKGRSHRIGLGCLVFLLLTVAWLAWPINNRLELHFIDVGQGDSTLIVTPNQGTVLVDAGGWRDELLTGRGAGNQVVVPYLHRLGINHLDVLIITHPHADHAGGARAVIKSMPVDMVVVSPYGLQEEDQVDEGYEVLLNEIRQQGILLRAARSGDRLKIDSLVAMKFLSPAETYSGTRADANNNSLVLLLNYQGRTALFTGDIETEAEEDLLQRDQIPGAEILKVPHHGSGYFHPDFFIRVSPEIAVISAGANNRFGHPSPKTLEALQEFNSKIYRTDRQGAVILTTEGVKWKIKTGK